MGNCMPMITNPDTLHSNLINAVRNGDLDKVAQCLERGANIEAADHRGETALTWAAMNGHQTIVESLIYRGADINAADHLGNTAISYVIKGFFSPEHQNNDELKDDYRETFKILAEHNAVINEETQAILDEKDERDELKQYTGCIERWVFK